MNEGSMKKGLHNDMPSNPRPSAPRGQSIGTMMIAVDDWEQLRQENADLRQQVNLMKNCLNCNSLRCPVCFGLECWQMMGGDRP